MAKVDRLPEIPIPTKDGIKFNILGLLRRKAKTVFDVQAKPLPGENRGWGTSGGITQGRRH